MSRAELPEGLEGLAVIRLETNDVVIFRQHEGALPIPMRTKKMLQDLFKVEVLVLPHDVSMEIVKQGDVLPVSVPEVDVPDNVIVETIQTSPWKVCPTCNWGGNLGDALPPTTIAPHGECRQCGSHLQPGKDPYPKYIG